MLAFKGAAAGLIMGALAGFAWFLVILFMPSNAADDFDGGAAVYPILFVMCGLFVAACGIAGAFVGLAVGSICHLANGRANSSNPPGYRAAKPDVDILG